MKRLAKFILLMLLLSAFLISCNNSNFKPADSKPTRPLLTYDLNELPERTTLKLSDLGAIDIQYIPLETSEKSVISGIQKVIRGKEYFLTQSYNDINMFRYDGSFITKIGVRGRGPDEFTVAHDVEINPRDETIFLLDGWQQKFLVYSNNGEFIRTFKYPLRASVDFIFTEDGILCYNRNSMGDIETSYILIDITGQIIKSYPNKYPWIRNIPTLAFNYENIFYNYGPHFFKKEIYCDTLYKYINKDFEPYAVIHIKEELRITPKVRSESDGIFIIQNYINPCNLFEFADYIYYEFGVPQDGNLGRYSFIGSKGGNFSVLFDPGKDLINDLDGGPKIRPRAIWDDWTVVSWINAIDLKTLVTSESFRKYIPKYPKKKEELVKLVSNMKDTDNPVLMLVRLKK